MVRVRPEELTFCGKVGEMLTPVGNVPAASEIVPEKPFLGVMLICTVAEFPGTREMLEGLTVMVKSGGGGGGGVGVEFPLPPPQALNRMQRTQTMTNQRGFADELDIADKKTAATLPHPPPAYKRAVT